MSWLLDIVAIVVTVVFDVAAAASVAPPAVPQITPWMRFAELPRILLRTSLT